MVINALISMVFGGGGLRKSLCLKGFNGFTLAEVLITLVIVGIISVMTVPTLIYKTSKQEFAAKLKKVYSTLSKATNKIIFEEGSPKGWADTNEKLYNTYKKYLQLSKDCGRGASCFPDVKYRYIKSTGSHRSFMDERGKDINLYSVKLSDGVAVLFGWTDEGQCVTSDGGSFNKCASIMVDLNGDKGPNRYGLDYFQFVLKEDGFYPMGCDDSNDHCRINQDAGGGCACKVLREGAINYL